MVLNAGFGLDVQSIPTIQQFGMLADIQDFCEQREIATPGNVSSLPPVAEILHRRVERSLRRVAGRRTKLVGKRHIVQMSLLDAKRIQKLMPCFTGRPIA